LTSKLDNEYYGMDESLVVDLNQAAINAIRATGATTQYIFAEGNSYTGAWTWTSVNTDMIELTDPSNKLIYEMHQYLDSDGSGTSDVCVNSTIGQSRVESATQWLISNQKVAFLGEFAAGANSLCEEAVTGMLSYMEQNSDVWLGAEWWSAGPWWADYIFSMEPPSGTAYEYYISVLEPYFPGGSGPTTTTTTTATTSTAVHTSTTSSASSTSTAVAQEWGQCGGVGWTGPTVCASPWTCQEQNAYYSQCL
jgi:endoglucanase